MRENDYYYNVVIIIHTAERCVIYCPDGST